MASSGGGRGGWGTFFKQELGRGGIIFTFQFFFLGGGSVLERYTFLKTTPPPPPRT